LRPNMFVQFKLRQLDLDVTVMDFSGRLSTPGIMVAEVGGTVGRVLSRRGVDEISREEYAHADEHACPGGNMSATRRTQLLMDPQEFRRLRALARRRKTSVAELIRSAVRTVYLSPPPDREAIVQDILKMNLPPMDWKKVRKEIEAGHAGLP